jgi:hypothetical protein
LHQNENDKQIKEFALNQLTMHMQSELRKIYAQHKGNHSLLDSWSIEGHTFYDVCPLMSHAYDQFNCSLREVKKWNVPKDGNKRFLKDHLKPFLHEHLVYGTLVIFKMNDDYQYLIAPDNDKYLICGSTSRPTRVKLKKIIRYAFDYWEYILDSMKLHPEVIVLDV